MSDNNNINFDTEIIVESRISIGNIRFLYACIQYEFVHKVDFIVSAFAVAGKRERKIETLIS